MNRRGRRAFFVIAIALFFGSLFVYMDAWVRLHPTPVTVMGCGQPAVTIVPEVPDRAHHEAVLSAGMLLMIVSGIGILGGTVAGGGSVSAKTADGVQGAD